MKKGSTAQTRRMTSITRKLHWSWIGKKIGLYIGSDVLLFLMLMAGWICDREAAALGGLYWKYPRALLNGGAGRELVYRVSDESGKALFTLNLLPALQVAAYVLLAVAAVQILRLFLSYRKEDKKIRDILAPINEIALKADELSKMTFTEDKYQQIEDAISHLSPEEAELLSFGDADLQGIEAAMNNLLIRMRDTYRQQARFVDDASHELRTPIAVIQGYADMLSRWGREDEKVLDESIAAIRHESEHMNYLVEQLLFLARGDSGKTRLNMERVDLNALMREVYEESFLIDEKHPYFLELYGEPSAADENEAPAADGNGMSAPDENEAPADDENGGLAADGDGALLKQAVRILVDNAAKYTREGDEIRLGTGTTEERRPYLQVQDAGVGMAEADVSHMFERFYRADDARGYQGSGLGLSIAKWIVDKHGGHFEILSRTGLGTRIRIIL